MTHAFSALTYEPTRCLTAISHPGEETIVINLGNSSKTTAIVPVTTPSILSYNLFTFTGDAEFYTNTTTALAPGQTVTVFGPVISAFYEATDSAISSTWESIFARQSEEYTRSQSEYAAYVRARGAGAVRRCVVE